MAIPKNKQKAYEALMGDITENFRDFFNEIILYPDKVNQPFQDQLDDDISQSFNKDDPAYKMVERFFAVFTYARDHGKAQALTSKVLTPTCWKTIGELKVGDELVSPDGSITHVTQLHPISEMELYEVETYDGRKTLCNGDHLWNIYTPQNHRKAAYTVSLKYIKDNYYTERVDKRNNRHYREYIHRIGAPSVLPFSEKKLLLEPYLFGVWLGDGTSSNGALTTADPEILDYLQCDTTKRKAKYSYGLLGIRRKLVGLNVLGNKYIPRVYLFSSIDQRLELLRGLMDTDGSCHQDGDIAYFYNTNKDIVDGVMHVVRSLGGRAMCSPKETKCNGKVFQSWVVSIKLQFNPFKLKRKADKWKGVNSKGDYTKNAIVNIKKHSRALARCITVEKKDGLYITDDFLVTHNSSHISIGYPLWRIAKDHNVRILAVSRTATIAQSFLSEIVSHIERNDRYKEWAKYTDPTHTGVIPRTKPNRRQTEDWSGSSITIDRPDHALKDPTIAATGLFGQILSRRADIILCDDIVDQQNSATEGQRKKVIEWMETTVLPVLVPGGTFIYLGNTWHHDDLVARFLKDPRFIVAKRQGAIIKEADRQDLWQEWGTIMLNTSIPPRERFAAAQKFYDDNREEMDKGWETLWPERYPYSRLYLERLLNPFVFARMYQCNTSDRPDQKIKDEWIEAALEKGKNLRFQDQPHEGNILQISAGGMDLAISQKESSDDTALVYLDLVKNGGNGVNDGDYILRQIHRGHYTPKEQREAASKAWRDHGLQTIRVETVAYQAALAIDLQEEGVNVRSYNTGREKLDPEIGINSLALLMENGKLIIPSDPTHPRTIELASQIANEMRAFTADPTEHTGDGLMALWFAYSEVRQLMGANLYFNPTSPSLKDSPPVKTKEDRADMEQKADKALQLEQEYERSNYNKMIGEQMRRFRQR